MMTALSLHSLFSSYSPKRVVAIVPYDTIAMYITIHTLRYITCTMHSD